MHEEIINLIESPELREHLLHNPQLLSGDHYMQIIGGAPIEISRKRELISRLAAAKRNSADDTFCWYDPKFCIDYIDGCLDALKAVDGNKNMLLVSEISFVDSEVGSAITHGPFPVASWPAALAAMKSYAEKWRGDTDLSASYWMIELFNLANDPSDSYPYDGFLQPATPTTPMAPAKSNTSAGRKRVSAARHSIVLLVESLGHGSRGRTSTYPRRTKRVTFSRSIADPGHRGFVVVWWQTRNWIACTSMATGRLSAALSPMAAALPDGRIRT